MKSLKYSIYLVVVCLLLPLRSVAQEDTTLTRKKVAVVFSGGGAKGAAHIGVLKVIERVGLPVDIVVGTSMGAIVGGLYALGYTPHQLDSMARTLNWNHLLTDRAAMHAQSLSKRRNAETFTFSVPLKRKNPTLSGLIRGENINNVLAELTVGYHDSIDFKTLPRTFACVATDMSTGKDEVFTHGRLSSCIRASMAIPGMFSPLRIGDKVYGDGGMSNNFPVDVARKLGADVVIGVSVQSKLRPSDELDNMTTILSQVVDFAMQNKLHDNIEDTDLYRHIDTDPFVTTSFNLQAIDSLITMGEHAMQERINELDSIKQSLGCLENEREIEPFKSLDGKRNFYLNDIRFVSNDAINLNQLLKKCRLTPNAYNSLDQIDAALFILRDELAYANANYRLIPKSQGYDLEITVETKKDLNLNLGLRFDTEENAAIVLGVTHHLNTKLPQSVSLVGRVGQRYMGHISYSIMPSLLKYFDVSYGFIHNDLDIYKHGHKIYNINYHQHQIGFKYSNMWWHNLKYSVGARLDAFTKPNVLYMQTQEKPVSVRSGKFVCYFANVKYSSFDSSYFPTRGVEFSADYTVYTDNFYQRRKHTPFSAISTELQTVIPTNCRLDLLPSVAGRFLIGKDVSHYYENFVGGQHPEQYLSQQIPFEGVYTLQVADRSTCVGSLKLRYRLAKSQYLTLAGSVSMMDEKITNLFNHKPHWGASLSYGLNSVVGPIQTTLGYSSHSSNVRLFCNLGYYF
ncbi:MAG: patatin-like phospholipase family protein [Bacteroidaceae bacterium]|nr:patatin-like phospholipase family protein [Bacteroidaceae bacterium]